MLVAVLLAVAIMSVLVVAVTALTRSAIASQGLETRRFATQLALRSALETAKALIIATPAQQRIYLDATPVTVDLGQGLQAELTIRDAAGLVDLNRSELPLIEATLAETLDTPQATTITTQITQWRKQAEDQTAAAAPAQKPARKPGDKADEKQGENARRASHLPLRRPAPGTGTA